MNDILEYLSVETKIAIAVDLWDELEHGSVDVFGTLIGLLAEFVELEYNLSWIHDTDCGPCVSRLAVTIPGEGILI